MTLDSTLNANGLSSLHVHSKEDYINQGLQGDLYNDIITKSIEKYGRIYIIDSYRTPIERKISSFFQNLHMHVPDTTNTTVDRLIDLFNKYYLKDLEEYHSCNGTFDHYGIPYWTSFDFKEGYNIHEVDNKVFIKLRFADIDRWGSYLSEIFGKPIEMVVDNMSEQKAYAELYKEFKAKYKVPCIYLLTVSRDKDFNVYTTPAEKLQYLKNWVKNSCR